MSFLLLEFETNGRVAGGGGKKNTKFRLNASKKSMN